MARRSGWMAPLAMLAACAHGGAPDAAADAGAHRVAARDTSAVVATVDGEPVTADEVTATARAEGLSDAHEALERAVRSRLLAREAQRRGMGEDVLLEDTARRGEIQALLAETVEREVRPDDLPAADLEAGMRIRGFELAHGELWVTKHCLGRTPEGMDAAHREAARTAAEAFRARAAALAPEERTGAGFERLCDEVYGRAAHRAETLPGIDAEGRHSRGALVAPYTRAATALRDVGELSPVVQTDFGYHVIVLLERQPALERPEEEVRAMVRDELLWRLRRRALERLLEGLRARYGARVTEQAARAVADLPLAGGAP